MKLAWLLANSIASAWYGEALFHNPMRLTIGRRWGHAAADNAPLVLLGVLFMVHGVLAGGIAFAASVNAAIIVTSMLTFAWAQSAYFLLQRFVPSALDRPFLAGQYPAFYPLSAFVSFALSVTAFVLFAGWPLAFVPLVVYLICGFLCAEIAIQRVVRQYDEGGHGKDRRLAISVINAEQGRGGYSYRYPFIMYGSTNRAYTVLGWYYRAYYRIRNSRQSSRRTSKSTEPDEESSRPIKRGPELIKDGRGKGQRILITDDNAAARDVIKDTLEYDGYEVVTLESKVEALERLREIKPDLVTTDLYSPRMSGLEFIQLVKELDPSIPVLVISGNLTAENAREAIRLGAFDCLRKPYSVAELRQMVDRALETRRSSSEI